MGGYKPLATIERDKDLTGYCMAKSMANVGTIYAVCRPTSDCPRGEIVFTKPSNKHLIDEYDSLLATGVADYGIKEYHRRMGKLFGYSDADIEAFINTDVHCDCAKCKGK